MNSRAKPQKLSRAQRGRINFEIAAIEQRPQLAVLLAEVIAAWGHIEAELGKALAGLLRADADVAMAMYMSVTSPSTQRELLEAAARARLTGDPLLLFQAIVIVAWGIYSERNKIAHCSWAVHENMPDALLWVPHTAMLRASANMQVSIHSPSPRRFDPKKVLLDVDLIRVYRADVFRDICSRAYHVREHLISFDAWAKRYEYAVVTAPGRVPLYTQICTAPDVAPILERLRKAHPNSA